MSRFQEIHDVRVLGWCNGRTFIASYSQRGLYKMTTSTKTEIKIDVQDFGEKSFLNEVALDDIISI